MQARPLALSVGLDRHPGGILLRYGIAGLLAVLVVLAFTRNVNWDEFYFLSHVHAWLDGRLDRPMQTFFVRGFGWLAGVSDNEVDQIKIARLVMVACVAVTSFAIYQIAAAMTDATAAKVAVLAYLASGFVLPHGASFRADPIAASLMMTAAAVITVSEMRLAAVMIVAVSVALALLVTVKSALYLPVMLAALVYRFGRRDVVIRGIAAGALALALAALAYVWHASTLVVAEGNDTASNARDAVTTALLSGQILPRRSDIVLWVMLSLPALILVIAGLRSHAQGPAKAYCWLFALPCLSLVVYRNAFPYFFPFIAAPLMVLVAQGVHRLHHDRRVVWSVRAMLLLGLLQGALAFQEDNAAQKATLSEVHRLFPTPVPYIDEHGMVASFPKHGFFMSSWGLQNYRAAGHPVFSDIIASSAPPLLLATRKELINAVRFGDSKPGALLPSDQTVLQQTYIHYSGVIWLAGRSFTGTGAEVLISMPIAGRYRIESDASVLIDGVNRNPGDEVALGLSGHRIIAAPGVEVRLIWSTAGSTLSPPDLPEQGLYSGFWHL